MGYNRQNPTTCLSQFYLKTERDKGSLSRNHPDQSRGVSQRKLRHLTLHLTSPNRAERRPAELTQSPVNVNTRPAAFSAYLATMCICQDNQQRGSKARGRVWAVPCLKKLPSTSQRSRETISFSSPHLFMEKPKALWHSAPVLATPNDDRRQLSKCLPNT